MLPSPLKEHTFFKAVLGSIYYLSTVDKKDQTALIYKLKDPFTPYDMNPTPQGIRIKIDIKNKKLAPYHFLFDATPIHRPETVSDEMLSYMKNAQGERVVEPYIEEEDPNSTKQNQQMMATYKDGLFFFEQEGDGGP